MKRQNHKLWQNIHYIYLRKDLYPEYIKNAYKSVVKKTTQNLVRALISDFTETDK